MIKNENCVVSDTSICKWIDKDCEKCYIGSMKHDDDRKEALHNFEVMLSLLPEDFDTLGSEECQFCKKDKRPRAGYALTDLAHAEPESKRGMFFGIGKKVRRRIGSLLPVNISICKECRNSFRLAEVLKWLMIAGFLAVAIALVSIPGVSSSINEASSVLPYAIVIGGGLVGYIIGKLATTQFVKAKSEAVYFNVFDIPVCKEMKDNGWFLVQETGNISRFIFTKKPMIRKIGELKQLEDKKGKDFTQTSFFED